MEVNGIAHIFLTASNLQRSREFYRQLLSFLCLEPVIDTDTTYYCVGGRTAVGINAPGPEHVGAAFEQSRVGLHHLCFRARERAGVASSLRAQRSNPALPQQAGLLRRFAPRNDDQHRRRLIHSALRKMPAAQRGGMTAAPGALLAAAGAFRHDYRQRKERPQINAARRRLP